MTRRLSVQAKVSTLALAAALVAGPSPAVAQSFQGTLNGATGATVDQSVVGQTTVTVNQSQAVVNWTATNAPNSGIIVFQPDGTTATFTGASDFAILNRIAPGTAGNAVYMGGIINSLVNGNTGGTVYFYSPNGIVIGQNASINVGSLGLTTLPISDDGNGNWMTGFGGPNPTVTFGQATDPNSYIRTDTVIDGSIRANGSGSYVALVAPSIEHKGVIHTDGAAALVAAEAATITFSPDGLFDIQVTTGTDAATGVYVNGGTIDRNSATEGADHRAYLVAVAKNDAVTILIDHGGSVGFDTATSAQNGENNSVILSGGYDVAGGDHDTYSGVSQVDLTITNATLSSNVNAKVTGGAAINSGQGALTFGGDLTISGGAKTSTGGNVLIDGQNGNALTIAGNLMARSFRQGANGAETGLITRLGATGASTVTVGGDVLLDSSSYGASAVDNGFNGGNATGGSAQINIDAGSSLHISGSADVLADGYGGSNFFGDGAGGDGVGGQALVMAINGNSSVTIDGSVYVSAQGFGGTTGECTSCNITGGKGTGGNASVHTNGGTNNQMTLGSDVRVTAEGWGGAGDAQAGIGLGGNAGLSAGNSSSLSVTADTEVNAGGYGGYGFNTANGGLGTGGNANVSANNSGSVTLAGPVLVAADGLGGDGKNGGTGTGGVAGFNAVSLGTLHALNDVAVSANSDGGFANDPTGTGGSGLADNETATTPAFTEAGIFASSGTITIDGLTFVTATATGGDGGFNGGNGGNAVAGGIAGTIGGGAVIHAANSDIGPSTINLGTVIVTADAQGGQGGAGQGGTNGSNGGNGGNATAGKAVITAAAGSGHVTAGSAIASASATGGDGGDGGNGDGGTGGNAGNGGSATGGFINIGTESGNQNFAQAANNGTANYSSIVAIAAATGGNGGNSGFGTTAGTVGNGGDAFAGNSVLLVRGSVVTVGAVNLDASATGGDSGLDTNDIASGRGGDAITGVVGVVVSSRFQHADQRGTLNAGAITGNAVATGGTGASGGGQYTQGGSAFTVINSDATINAVSLVVTADGPAPNPFQNFNNPIAVVNSSVTITNGFNFQTPGTVSVYADDPTPASAALTAATINIGAGNFIHDDDPSRPGPASFGRLAAGNIVLTTGQDLIVDANLFSNNGVNFNAPGLIKFQNVNSNGPMALTAGGTIDTANLFAGALVSVTGGSNVTVGTVNAANLQALVSSTNGNIVTGAINAGTFIGLNAQSGSITTGNLTSGSLDVFAQADNGITTGNIDSGTAINVISLSDFVNVGDLSAGTDVNLDAAGSVTFGDVSTDSFDFDAGTSAIGGNIVAGTEVKGDAGTTVTLGNINVGLIQAGGAADDGFAVGISAPGSIIVGDVAADEAIGFVTLANLTGGNFSSGTLVMTLIGGNTSLASITTPGTGRVYHGDAQMFLDAGGGNDNFDPSLVLNATPLRSGGSYTVAGAISTGRIQVGAAAISTAAITAPTGIYLDSSTSTATGGLSSNGLIHALSGGSIQTGNISSSGSNILLEAGTNIATGTLAAATDAEFDAGGNVNIGNANLGGNLLVDSGGNLTTGAVVADLIDATAAGLATLNGLWQAPDVELISNDIEIASTGGIDAGNNGFIRLVSTNGTQALIGDGLTGTGYQLGNAEFGRLHAGNLEILARGDASAAIDMLIGDLAITGPSAGSTIGDPNGSVVFAVGNPQTETVGGVIRVTRSLRATGFTDTNALEFYADRFELDAETGLIDITSTGTTLSGELFIAADRVHAASSSILDQLAADPNYDGHEDDLNAPATVQRPDGVLRAGSIEVFSNNPLSVLMQNTGTAELPAGFVTFGDEPLLTGATGVGPIEMVINGQLITEGGQLTGSDVLDFLIDANNVGFFTANSMINGCALTGRCSSSSPIPPETTPTPGIQDVVTIINDDVFPEPDFGNEGTIDDNDEETDDSATSPITPPDPLFDTSEVDEGAAGGTEGPEVGTTMRSTPGLTRSGDVDDPVSGSGNPGLMDNPPPPTNEEKQP